MNTSRKVIGAALLALALAFSAAAQKPRSVADDSAKKDPPKPAPQTVTAKYEGGVFGYNKKQEGTLTFDDVNSRLVFRNKQQKEVLFIPYAAINQEFADTQSRRPKSATILGSIPMIYGPNPIGFIKTKNQYVTVQFYDQDAHTGGVTSFRVENKEICAAVVNTLAEKAGLVPLGEIFVRKGGDVYASRGASRGEPMVRVDASERPAVTVENEMLSGRVISLPRPVYPEEARQQKVTGTVRVLVTVDEKGNVTDAEAVSGTPLLQGAAVDAARQARFEPISREGRPAKTKTIISYNFQLY